MSETITESLTATEDSTINITTTADVIKPVFRYAGHLVEEFKLRTDGDTLRYKAVDAANVGMITQTVPVEVFEEYDHEGETVTGLQVSDVKNALRAGRMSKQDTIDLSITPDRFNSKVERDYDGVHMDLENSIRTVDPDSLRQEPDLPDLDLPATATVPVTAFTHAIEAADAVGKHATFRVNGSDLVITGENGDDTDGSRAVLRDVVDSSENVESLFSLDYLTDMVTAFKQAKADELALRLGDEFPVIVEWERDVNDHTITGQYMQAPRISE